MTFDCPLNSKSLTQILLRCNKAHWFQHFTINWLFTGEKPRLVHKSPGCLWIGVGSWGKQIFCGGKKKTFMDCRQCQGVFDQKLHTGLCCFPFMSFRTGFGWCFTMTSSSVTSFLSFVREFGHDGGLKGIPLIQPSILFMPFFLVAVGHENPQTAPATFSL